MQLQQAFNYLNASNFDKYLQPNQVAINHSVASLVTIRIASSFP